MDASLCSLYMATTSTEEPSIPHSSILATLDMCMFCPPSVPLGGSFSVHGINIHDLKHRKDATWELWWVGKSQLLYQQEVQRWMENDSPPLLRFDSWLVALYNYCFIPSGKVLLTDGQLEVHNPWVLCCMSVSSPSWMFYHYIDLWIRVCTTIPSGFECALMACTKMICP